MRSSGGAVCGRSLPLEEKESAELASVAAGLSRAYALGAR